MVEFLTALFDTAGFPARWQCGTWTATEGWLHILSDLGIWSAYLAISYVLVYFALRRRNLPFKVVFLLFGAFILACGTTHLLDAVIFWWPAYRLAGVLKLFTALVSWGTVVALVNVAPRAFALRSPDELGREVNERNARRNLPMPCHRWCGPPAPAAASTIITIAGTSIPVYPVRSAGRRAGNRFFTPTTSRSAWIPGKRPFSRAQLRDRIPHP